MIPNLSTWVGILMFNLVSNLPDLTNASSNYYILLVAAITTTYWLSRNPSISVINWLSVLFLSLSELFSTPSFLLLPPIPSISSINTIQGWFSLAYLNNSLILLAPTPTYISMNSDALEYKKCDYDSVAVALANNVLPVPGEPYMRIPFLSLAPIYSYSLGFYKYDIISFNSFLASSQP